VLYVFVAGAKAPGSGWWGNGRRKPVACDGLQGGVIGYRAGNLNAGLRLVKVTVTGVGVQASLPWIGADLSPSLATMSWTGRHLCGLKE
jgi:hypothetical protein